MKKYFEVFSHCSLFAGIGRSDLKSLLECLNSRTVNVPKGKPIFLEGDPVQFVGVVLRGTVQVIREDYDGNRSVMASLQPGQLFAEVFSCAGFETMPVSVMAFTDSEVLLLDCRRVFTTCSNACHFHNLLVKNLMKEMARKNLELTQKIRYMSQKTTREKLFAYLQDQAKQQGSREFVIPHNRQSLADYLGVERSAMSAEISKLKKDGLLDTRGSWFCLK